MFKQKFKKEIYFPFILLNIFMFGIFLFIGYQISWLYMGIYIVVQSALAFISYHSFEQFKYFYEQYISTLSKRLQRSRDQAFNEIPIGVLIYSSDLEIEWINPYMTKILGEEALIGKNLKEVDEHLFTITKDEIKDEYIKINSRIYKMDVRLEERVIYLMRQNTNN